MIGGDPVAVTKGINVDVELSLFWLKFKKQNGRLRRITTFTSPHFFRCKLVCIRIRVLSVRILYELYEYLLIVRSTRVQVLY